MVAMMVSLEIPSSQLICSLPVRAAQYVRMSTEHQQYSTDNQLDALRVYAVQRGIEIVRTYADEGKSGLTFNKRPALRQLIQDVVSGAADYSLVLVYDVSRWGRFLDADESAHYEFLCRQAGIQIRYCAERFGDDENPMSALLKSMKRVMAAEYSKDLSAKVFIGQRRVVKLGYWPGSPAGLGLRRMLVDENGRHKGQLKFGSRKSITTDRIILVPGPKDEIAMVRRIFRCCAAGQPIKAVAESLNSKGFRTVGGNLWSPSYVGVVVHNEKYIGNLVWNRRSSKLGGRAIRNPRSKWVRSENVFKPIVSRELFDKAQRVIEERKAPRPESELLNSLKKLLARRGYLSLKLIHEDEETPSVMCYRYHFGGILSAYDKIGYTPKTNWRLMKVNLYILRLRERIAIDSMERLFHAGRDTVISLDKRLVTVASNIVIQFISVRCRVITSGAFRWNIRPLGIRKTGADLVVIIRMKENNKDILDYYLLPQEAFGDIIGRLSNRNGLPWDAFRSDTIEPLYVALTPGFHEELPTAKRILRAIQQAGEHQP